MTKQQFLQRLSDALCDLPQKDVRDSLDYYAEMIDDRVEAGMTEEAAIAELATPERAAQEILLAQPMPTLIRSRCKPRRAWRAWEVVLLILGSPVWLPLLVAAAAVVFCVYAVVWAAFAALWALDLSLLAAALCMVAAFVFTVVKTPLSACMGLGVALIAAGGAILLFFACLKLTALFVKCSIWMWKALKRLIIGKERKV